VRAVGAGAGVAEAGGERGAAGGDVRGHDGPAAGQVGGAGVKLLLATERNRTCRGWRIGENARGRQADCEKFDFPSRRLGLSKRRRIPMNLKSVTGLEESPYK